MKNNNFITIIRLHRMLKSNNFAKLGFGLILLLAISITPFIIPQARAAACVSNGTGGGNWNAAGTWTSCGGTFPGSGDTVTVAAGDTVTVNVASATAGATVNATGVLSIANNITLTVGGNVNGTGQITLGGNSSALRLTGDWNFSGTYSHTNRLNVTFNGTGDQTIASSAVATWRGITVNKMSGTLFMSMTPTISTTRTFTAGNISYNGGAQIVLPGTYPAGYTLTLAGSGAKTITSVIPSGNLTLSGTATATTAAAMTIGGNLDVGSGTVLATGATNTWTLQVNGTTSVSGTLTLANTGNKSFRNNVVINGTGVWNETGVAAVSFWRSLQNDGSFTASATGLHDFSGTTQTISGANPISIPGTITFTGATCSYVNSAALSAGTISAVSGGSLTNDGTVTVGTALSGTGTFAQGATGVLNHAGTTIGISTFSASASGNTVNYNGTTQTVRAVTYHNLSLSTSNAKTLTSITTVNGNLSMSGSASATTASALAIGGNVDLAGTSSLTAGAALTVTGNFTIGSTVAFSAGSYTHNIAGNWTNNGGTFTPSTGTINLNGSSSQAIGGSSNTTFGNLTVNNSAGVTLSGTSPIVGGTLTLTSGKITTGANTLAITTAGSISGAGSGKYIYGNLQKSFNTGAGQSFNYAIGDASNYTPVNIANANVGTAGSLSLATTAGAHPNLNTSTINPAKNASRYWSFMAAGGLAMSNYNSTFNFVAGDVIGSADTSSFIVGKYNAGWTYPTVGTKTSTSTQVTGLSSFSDFQAGELNDSTPPTVLTVAVQTGLTVDITFSEAMGTGVTTASNYTVSGSGQGALANNPNSVGLVSGNTYRATWTSGEMLNSGDITITVINAQDLAGNAIAGSNSGTHTGGAIGSAPTVTGVDSTLASGSYKQSHLVPITVTFDEIVYVLGTPQLTISTGSPATTVVDYSTGSGSSILTFNYTVAAGNTSADLDYSATTSLVQNGGSTIKDAAGNDATLTLATPGAAGSLGANKNIIIDTALPVISSVTPITGVSINNTATTVGYTLSENVVSASINIRRNSGQPDGGAPHLCTLSGAALNSGAHSPFNLTGCAIVPTLVDGTYYDFDFNATDAAGNAATQVTTTNVKFDTTLPTVTNVTSTLADGFYKAGQLVPVTVTFSEPVIVTNIPQLTLSTGTPATTAVNYSSGSTTSTLTFNYTVSAGNINADLDYTATTSLGLNGGTIKDAAGNDATRTLATPGAAGSLGFNKAIFINTIAPTLTQVTPVPTPTNDSTPNYTFSSDEQGTITYGGDCSSSDTTVGALDILPANKTVNFNTLADGVHSNCTIKVTDRAGNDSNTLNVTAFTVDTIPPTVTGVTSTLGNGSYKAGQVVPVTVTFDEDVNVTGVPQITLSTGSPTTTAVNYSAGTGSNILTFDYTVAAGNTSADLDYASINALALNGGTIKGDATNNAVLTLVAPGAAGSLGANKNIVIDTASPSAPGIPDMTAGTDTGASSTDNRTINTAPDFTVSCESGATVTLRVNGSNDSTGLCAAGTVTIALSAQLDATYSIDAIQTDLAGNISTDSGNLSIIIDTVSSVISSVSWADINASTNIDESDEVIVTFSKAMDASTINMGNVDTRLQLSSSHTFNAASAIWGGGDTTLTIVLGAATDVASGDTIDPEDVNVKDLAGNSDNTSAPVAILDNIRPKVVSVTDTTFNAGDTVVLEFSEPMDTSTITDANADSRLGLSLHTFGTSGDLPTAMSAVWNPAGTFLTVTLGSSETIIGGETIDPTASVTDVAGNADNTPAPIILTVDVISPWVDSVTWNDLNVDTKIDATDSVVVNFSEAMDKTTVTIGNVNSVLQLSGGHSFYPTALTWNVPGTAVTITLGAGAGSVVSGDTIDPDGNVKDLAGNPDATPAPLPILDNVASYILTFSTAHADGSFWDKAGNIPPAAGEIINLTVQYSEPVIVAGGTPSIALNSTGTATYLSGSGTDTLTFEYDVTIPEMSADLDYVATNSLALNGGTIKDGADNVASNTLPAVGTFAAAHAIVIDTTFGAVSNVYSDTPNGSYKAGTVIDVVVTFDRNIIVDSLGGWPRIHMNAGAPGRYATYVSGSGTTNLLFNYTVLAGDITSDLDYFDTAALEPNDSEITGPRGNFSDLTLSSPGAAGSLAANEGIVLDTSTPAAPSMSDLDPADDTGVSNTDNYTRNNSALTFTGTAEAGSTVKLYSDVDGLLGNTIAGGGVWSIDASLTATVHSITATATDAADNTSAPSSALSVTIDTTLPTISGVNTDGATLNLASSWPSQVIITFTDADLSNTPTVSVLPDGGSQTVTDCADGNPRTFCFIYPMPTVIDRTETINVSGGLGQAGNIMLPDATHTFFVDTFTASVTNVSSTLGNGTYTVGQLVPITVTFDEDLIVTGAPTILLETGVIHRNASYSSISGSGGLTTNVLTFNYTVQAGDNVYDLDYDSTGALVLNGGSISCAQGNNADLTLPALGGPNSIAGQKDIDINTIVPVFSSVTPVASSSINSISASSDVSYTMNENISGGTITMTRTGGTADGVHTCNLTGSVLNVGTHNEIDLSDTVNGCIVAQSLVDGAIYTFTFDAADAAGNTASTITRTGVIFDISPPAIPVESPAAGTYYSSQSMTLSSAGSTSIRYTTDGSTPLCASSTLYTGAMTVSSTRTIKAVGCDLAGNESPEGVFTYTIRTGGNRGDRTAPAISGIAVTTITQNSAVIIWNTDEVSTSSVNYHLSSGATVSSLDGNMTLQHIVAVTNLESGATYYFQVCSVDGYGNEKCSGEQNLTTLSPTAVEPPSVPATEPEAEPAAGDGASGEFSLTKLLGTFHTINLDKSLQKNTEAKCVSESLIKLPSDNNPATQEDSAIYFCGANGMRYAFPNPNVYLSWYDNFDGVTVISREEMAAIPLGGNVTYRPAVRLVKFTTDPKIYAVAQNGALRWVTTEEVANALYGSYWATTVHDINDAFFTNYRIGSPLTLTDIVH